MDFHLLKRNSKDIEYILIIVLLLISVLSSVTVYSVVIQRPDLGIGYFKKEIIYQVVGYAMMFSFMLLDYHTLRKLKWFIYGFNILTLVIVFRFPNAVHGAASWIPLPGGFQFQPSEFAKLGLIILLADVMATEDEKEVPNRGIKPLLVMFFYMIVPFVLTLKEPALGQALVFLAIYACMVIPFVNKKILATILSVGFVCMTAIVLAKFVYPDQIIHFMKQHHMTSYQMTRIITFLDPKKVSYDASMQVVQAQTAIGSGQLFGEGLLQGILTNGRFVPEQQTDMIFSALAEQFGFIGSTALIVLFLVMFYRMIRVASTALDTFGIYMIVGIIGMFAFQIFENIGMNILLMPLTGITLPFISYGGTSLVANFMMIGIVMSVSIRRRKLRFT
ncbi:rod shape-determining protein RodA [Fodinisporobacter ferrooxydans]|uniref:Rod shape-determining protein RodA n=1 Tax=Fodinisporobacter ferrooxydans TaxID=2901836 RepID=A0ABY4CJK8_9BACL|nr:rod shape-determining protein RodA [Alicyclobacillaceae bacterium MYW30-H2]